MELFDTHAHLDFPEFKEDLNEVLDRAREAEVRYIINVSTSPQSLSDVLAIADRFEGCYAAVGIHPHWAHKVDDEVWDQLSDAILHPKVVAIGETGLDFVKSEAGFEDQVAVFRRQVELAMENELPVIVHSRGAFPEMMEL